MALISEETIKEVRNVGILDLAIALGDNPKKIGTSYQVYCPNPEHSEKTPDTYIAPAKSVFTCFGGGGCGCKGNDAITYFLWHEFGNEATYNSEKKRYVFPKTRFPEAIEGIADIMGIDIKYKNGGTKKATKPKVTPRFVSQEKVEPADADTCDRVYRSFLLRCPIRAEHGAEWLNERGYSKDAVLAMGLRSVPDIEQTKKILLELKKKGISFERVPGFTQKAMPIKMEFDYPEELTEKDGEYQWFWMINAPKNGYFIPVRDELGRIVRLRVRRDDGHPKYLWFSSQPDQSAEKCTQWHKGGAPSGAPVNVVLPTTYLKSWKAGTPIERIQNMGVVIATEGEHKSQISADHLQVGVVGVPGVGIYQSVLPLLQKWKTKRFYLAYDMDSLKSEKSVSGHNKQVFQHLLDFAKMVLHEGIDVRLLTWDVKDGKGLDDLLSGGKYPYEVNLRTKQKNPLNLSELKEIAQ